MLYAINSIGILNMIMNILKDCKCSIRYASNEDYLFLITNDLHISEEELYKSIDDNKIIVLTLNDKIIGWLRYNLFWDNIPFMNMLYLLEEYRRVGLGSKLVSFWENEMKNKGYENVLTSTQSNEDAQYFYRKIGYKEIGGFTLENDPYEIIFEKRL